MTQYSAPAPPGWYPDPGLSGHLRWFDGTAWTAHVHAAHAPQWGPGPALPAQRDRAIESLVPINRTGLSIAAGYAGLFSMLIVFAPIALILGVLALRDLRDKPTVAGRGRAWFGVITGALGSLVLVAAVLH